MNSLPADLPADLLAELAAEPEEVEDPNCLLPPMGPARKQLYGVVKKLSALSFALALTVMRVCNGQAPLPAVWRGSPLRAIERAGWAACLAVALMLRVRHGIVVAPRPKKTPQETKPKGKGKGKPASGLGLPRIEPDAATMIARMTDAQAIARIRRDVAFAAKVFGYSDIVAQVTALADEAEALLMRPPAPLPPAPRAEAEVQRRRAERAAAAAAADEAAQRRLARRVAAWTGTEGSCLAYAAVMPPPPLPPDSG
jgi:hypothetical protein